MAREEDFYRTDTNHHFKTNNTNYNIQYQDIKK